MAYFVCVTETTFEFHFPPKLWSMRVASPRVGQSVENEPSAVSGRELAQVLEQCGDAVIVKDLNAVVTYWNREAAALYGFTARAVRILSHGRQPFGAGM